MKIYGIESRLTSNTHYHDRTQYRFYSRYNDARGGWMDLRQNAILEGELHQKLIQHQLGIDFESMKE